MVYLFGLVGLAFMLWLAFGIWRIGAVSRGDKVEPRTSEALLLIDLQTVFWEDGPYSVSQKVAAKDAILAEIGWAKSSGHAVIAVRQEWSQAVTKVLARLAMKGQAVAGTSGTEVAPPFVGLADHVIVKRVQDAFETRELDDLLAKLNVGRLRIVGLDLNYCVLKTALAARNRGYEVAVKISATLSNGTAEPALNRLRYHRVALE